MAVMGTRTHVARGAIIAGLFGTLFVSVFTYSCFSGVQPGSSIRPIGWMGFATLLSVGFFLYGAASAKRASELKEPKLEIVTGFVLCVLPAMSAFVIFRVMQWYLRFTFAP